MLLLHIYESRQAKWPQPTNQGSKTTSTFVCPLRRTLGRAKKTTNCHREMHGVEKTKKGGKKLKSRLVEFWSKFPCHDLKPFVYKLVKNCVKMSEMRLVKWSPTLISQSKKHQLACTGKTVTNWGGRGGTGRGKKKKRKKVKGTVWHLPMNGNETCAIALQYATHVNEK